ncbi:MAG: type IX secretion system outer membrane channel protein PorV [Flavobacteriales bacterium]|nr:type IX secretion system outer membrane channel protein PorV [Flavobacteriales bacterium]MCB9446879.1 type IX secretion system outer membrane channel protein PorV [Flavobacteriales bacterium]
MRNKSNTSLEKAAAACIVLSGLLVSGSAKAQLTVDTLTGGINTITTAVPFLMIGPDARAGGMGDAGVASTPDPNSGHWNAAKFAFIKDTPLEKGKGSSRDVGFSMSYIPWLRSLVPDINLAYISGYKVLKGGRVTQTVAGSLRYFSLGDITFTDIVGNVTGNFNPNEFAVDFSYARMLSENWSGGLSLRYIYSNLTGGFVVDGNPSHAGRSVAADVSGYYRKETEMFNRDVMFAYGIAITNVGAKISYTQNADRDFIPINGRMGTSLLIKMDDFNKVMFLVDVNKLLVPTPPIYNSDGTIKKGYDPDRSIASGIMASFYDAPGGFSEELKEYNFSLGSEYWYDNQFAIRAGYFHEDATKGNRKYFTIGAGLKYHVFGLDFAYLIPTQQKHPLENTLRFTLVFDFGGLGAENSGTE